MGLGRRLLHRLLHVSSSLRAYGPLYLSRCAKRPPLPGPQGGSAQAGQTVQREQEERVQATPGLKLYDPHADSCGHGLPPGRDTSSCSNCKYLFF